jgi:PAS domain S-box-containing protein
MGEHKELTRVLLVDPDGYLGAVERALHEEDDRTETALVASPDAVTDAEIEPDCLVVLEHPRRDVDGIKQMEAVRLRVPDVPIVIVAHDPTDNFTIEGLDAGAEEVISISPQFDIVDDFSLMITRRIRHAAGTGEAFQTDGELLDSLMEYLPHQVFIKDDTGRIAEASDVAAEEYSLTRQQMVGLTDHELFNPAHADVLWADEKRIMETEEPEINRIEHYVDEAGRDRWVSTTKAPRYDSDGNVVGLIGTCRDVTEQKRQEEMMNALHAASRDLVAAETRQEIGRIAVDIADDIPDLPVVEVALDEEGELHPVASGAVDDDTAREAATVEDERDDAAESEESDRGDAETEADEETSSIYSCYEEWVERAYETGNVQLIDQPPDESPSALEVESVSEAEVDIDPVAVMLPLGDHGVLGLASTSGTFDDFGIDLAEVLAANMEAALERAAREEALRARERELAQQNERLEEFASIVSHDLRNPLSVAQGYLAQVDVDEEIAGEIEWALDRMDRLTDELLTLAQQGQIVGETGQVSLERVAREAWQTVDTDTASLVVDDNGRVEADRERLLELFENLFRNAVEHAHDPDDPVTVTVGTLDGDRRGFYVADDGPGIPDDRKEQVFDQGYTTADDGTGFGLYIVETLADAHGWSVQVVDANGERGESSGARFEISDVGSGGN